MGSEILQASDSEHGEGDEYGVHGVKVIPLCCVQADVMVVDVMRCLACMLIAVLSNIALTPLAVGLIVFDSKTSVDNNKNVIDPGNSSTFPSGAASGSPWQHVVRYGTNNSTAVYLGHGYILTARHVTQENSGLMIQGVNYTRDATFAPLPITIPGSPSDSVLDMQLQKIVGDPALPVLPIAGPSAAVLNKASVLIGCGVGKGTVIANEGWNWGANSTKAFRWGTNETDGARETLTYSVGVPMNYLGLRVYFNSNAGASEAAGSVGDSGSALFQNFSGTWTLSGLTTTVSENGSSRYDRNTIISGDQSPDRTIFVDLGQYSWVLRYNHWKTHYGIGTSTADDNDSDGDGIPLLLEYALGLDPTKVSRAGQPVAEVVGSNLVITFSRLASATDIKLEVETSTTLDAGSWTVETPAISVVQGDTVFQTVKATVPMNGEERKFVRFKVTKL